MRSAPSATVPKSRRNDPTWEIAHLFPSQGDWSEEEYLALETNHLVEFSDGILEVLPMPTTSHQLLVTFLYRRLMAFVTRSDLGVVLVSALRVRLRSGKFREPDVLFVSHQHADRIGEDYWTGADLVMEVVSPDAEARRRDLIKKRREYAQAGIPEYWIVDPQKKRITVLRLAGSNYAVHGRFDKEQTATSHLLPGFAVDVGEVFAARQVRKSGGSTGKTKRGTATNGR